MFNYKWRLSDGYPAKGIEKHGLKVFSTFACGGGSTMGYKLAGYDVIGANDIDESMSKVYIKNHNPKHYYLCDIRELNKKIEANEVAPELFDLDILDGSPPCSTFSMSGSREGAWGEEKQFREGQSKQILDDLFFYFIETARLLKPKVVVAENVKGIILGNAKGYTIEIKKQLEAIGYNLQIFLLNAATMGVPQKRQRVFFIAYRNDFDLPNIKLQFDEKPILFSEIKENNCQKPECFEFPKSERLRLKYARFGDRSMQRADERIRNLPKGEGGFFNQGFIYENKIVPTITGQEKQFVFSEKRRLSDLECQLAGSYPLDYDFLHTKPKYLIGMSVPPVMTAQVAHQIYLQWLSKLKKK